jgi:hypothetical protein
MKRLLLLLVLFGIAVWYFGFRKESPSTSPSALPPPSGPFYECVRLAEIANSSLVAASAIASRPPVDPNEWSRVESDTQSAISTAEASCATSPEVSKALGLMRDSLSEFASASKGQGGATAGAQRQEQIYDLLNRARGR